VAVLLWPGATINAGDQLLYGVIILIAGVGGSLVDSLLGATVQAIYWCPGCEKETEKSPNHSCGSITEQIRGWKWMNNDAVNLTCTLSAALLALLLSIVVV